MIWIFIWNTSKVYSLNFVSDYYSMFCINNTCADSQHLEKEVKKVIPPCVPWAIQIWRDNEYVNFIENSNVSLMFSDVFGW